MKTLLNIFFETGDHECPYYTISVVVDGDFDFDELENAFKSYFDSDLYDEDEDFEDSVETVMNYNQAIGIGGTNWFFVEGKIPACDRQFTMWL